MPARHHRQQAPETVIAALIGEGSAAAQLMALLNDGEEETRLVGGCIRNALMGFAISDFDLATTMLPKTVMKRVRSAAMKAIPTGIDHGTVTVVVDGKPFEVTTLREDIATDGRHATVRFGRDFRADAMRRDFTMNALSLSADGVIHDYTGGIEAIQMRAVRFIGDADARICEDYLRILRFFRFSAIYAGELDRGRFAIACFRQKAGLGHLSRERIGGEFRKLMVAARAATVLAAMEEG